MPAFTSTDPTQHPLDGAKFISVEGPETSSSPCWDGVKVTQGTGMPVTARQGFPLAPSADFDGQCGQCGCQFADLQCIKGECQGCTVELENDTCRHVFTHRLSDLGGNSVGPRGFRPFATVAFRTLRRGEQAQGGDLGCGGVHDETITHTLRVNRPDANQALGQLDEGELIPEHSHPHDPILSTGTVPPPVVTEAGQASSGPLDGLPGGGAA